ncbi:hypothetical protein DVH24_040995 [Malus domestica]|uniref:Uncharacterized protein n=1 Tax=Malus domestica TaxID=3750 RepID=A0A498I7W5_MALDO|nr:hypothetical protein DVH24_040995 [Malus domestica]
MQLLTPVVLFRANGICENPRIMNFNAVERFSKQGKTEKAMDNYQIVFNLSQHTATQCSHPTIRKSSKTEI